MLRNSSTETYAVISECTSLSPPPPYLLLGLSNVDLIDDCLDRNKNNKDKCMFVIYIHANAVNNNKGNAGSGEQTSGLAMDFSIKVCQPILVVL